MTSTRGDEPRPRRVWTWIGGTALLLLLAGALVVGRHVARFRAIRAELAAHHGQLRVDDVPAWLTSVAGRESAEAFGRVRGITFRDVDNGYPVPLTDEDVVACVDLLTEFPELESVFVRSWDPLEDRSLIALRRLHGLRELSVLSSHFGNEAVRGIAEDLPELRFLALPGSQIDDEGAVEIAELVELRELHLDGSGIGDEGALLVANLPHLTELSISQTYVTDEGVRRVVERIPDVTVSDD